MSRTPSLPWSSPHVRVAALAACVLLLISVAQLSPAARLKSSDLA